MTHTFNPGPAMVEIATVPAGNIALLCSGLNKRHLISTEFLHPIRSMIPPEATAVIDAARRCRRSRSETAFDALYGAVDALDASIQPPDAWNALHDGLADKLSEYTYEKLRPLIKAVEKERKP